MSQMLPARVKEIEELLILMHEPASLDALVRVGKNERPLSDIIPGDDGRSTIDNLYRQSLSRALSEYLVQLPETQRNVVKWIHIEGKSRSEVGERLHLNPFKVDKIESTALRNLRLRMRPDPRFVEYSRGFYNYLR